MTILSDLLYSLTDSDDDILEFIQELEFQLTREEQIKMVMETCPCYGELYHHYRTTCTTLQLALWENKSEAVIFKLMEIGGKELMMKMDSDNKSTLSYACGSRIKSFEVISKLIEVGGKEMVISKDDLFNRTALYFAFEDTNIASLDKRIISKLIEIGGKELVLINSDMRGTALHCACWSPQEGQLEIISMLIETGGKELVMAKDYYGRTVLDYLYDHWDEEFSLEIISKLIEIGGKDLVMIKSEDGTALHSACKNSSNSPETISKLIKVGGRELLMINGDVTTGTALHAACENETISLETISMLVEIGGHELVMKRSSNDTSGPTALHAACKNKNISLTHQLISKLVEIGGRDLVMMNSYNGTALHSACDYENISLEIISKLIEIGGRELVMTNCKFGTALHSACENKNTSLEIISKLIKVGGRELVLMKCEHGTALLSACKNKNISLEIISKLIEIGGQELVMMTDCHGTTALHAICSNRHNKNSSLLEIISMLVNMGGQELVVKTNDDGTALHCACKNQQIPPEMISELIEVGGQEVLLQKDKDENIALYDGWFQVWGNLDPEENEIQCDKFEFMLEQSIAANVGGEFGIGGLFNYAKDDVQSYIYYLWEEVLPLLECVVNSLLEQHHQPPILHAAILAEAPFEVICDIINYFEFSISKVDSMNRYPIEVALDINLPWDKGLKEVIEATAEVAHLEQGIPTKILYSAAQYGLKWRYQMSELIEEGNGDDIHGCDTVTGLRLFMVAAMGTRNDLSAIYGIMRMGPEMSNENVTTKKRKLKMVVHDKTSQKQHDKQKRQNV